MTLTSLVLASLLAADLPCGHSDAETDALTAVEAGESLREGELSRLTSECLRILRNTVLARQGYAFTAPDLKTYFQAKPWYKPVASFDPKSLSSSDQESIDLCARQESRNALLKALRAEAKTASYFTLAQFDIGEGDQESVTIEQKATSLQIELRQHPLGVLRILCRGLKPNGLIDPTRCDLVDDFTAKKKKEYTFTTFCLDGSRTVSRAAQAVVAGTCCYGPTHSVRLAVAEKERPLHADRLELCPSLPGDYGNAPSARAINLQLPKPLQDAIQQCLKEEQASSYQGCAVDWGDLTLDGVAEVLISRRHQMGGNTVLLRYRESTHEVDQVPLSRYATP